MGIACASALADKALFLPVPMQSAQARVDMPLADGNDEIRVSVYEAFTDETSMMQLAVLREAARRGKKVKLLIDGVGSRSVPYAVLQALEADGVQVKVFHPLPFGSAFLADYLQFDHFMRRDHDKLYLATPAGAPEHGEMLTGSRNFGDEYFGLGPAAQRDVDVYYQGAQVKRAVEYFDKVWESSAARTPHLKYPRYRTDLVEARAKLDDGWMRVRAHRGLDLSGKSTWREKAREVSEVHFTHGRGMPLPRNDPDIVALIDRAKTSLYLVSPYVIPGGPIWNAIERAIRRGVKVKLLTNSRASSGSPAQEGYEGMVPEIAAMGMEIWEYQRPGQKLHAKAFVVDDEEVYLGSLNLDRRSLRLQTESGLIIRDGAFAREVADYFQKHIGQVKLAAKDGAMTRAMACGNFFKRILIRLIRNHL